MSTVFKIFSSSFDSSSKNKWLTFWSMNTSVNVNVVYTESKSDDIFKGRGRGRSELVSYYILLNEIFSRNSFLFSEGRHSMYVRSNVTTKVTGKYHLNSDWYTLLSTSQKERSQTVRVNQESGTIIDSRWKINDVERKGQITLLWNIIRDFDSII